MNIQSLFQKISNVTNPARFVEAGGRAPRVWTSTSRVVSEEFLRTTDQEKRADILSRMAVARDIPSALPGEESDIALAISVIRIGATEEWSVTLKQDERMLVSQDGSPAEMITLYKKLYRMLTVQAVGGGGRLAGWAFSIALAIITLYSGLGIMGGVMSAASGQQKMLAASPPDYAQMQNAYAQVAAMPPSVSSPISKPAAPTAQDSTLTAEEKKTIAAKANTLALASSGEPLLAFSDPQCPYCQQLESSLEEVAKSGRVKPTVIPVAFKDGSRDLAAAVLCSKDPAEAWKSTMLTGKPAGKVCAGGLKKVDDNNKLFADLRLSATPTLLSPKGLIVASYATAQELDLLMKH